MIRTAKAFETIGLENTMKKVIDAGTQFAEATKESANHVTSMVTNALEDSVIAARRMAKRGKYAAEDLLDQTAHGIKRHPFRSVATGVGIGVGLGVIGMWLYRRNGHH
jgi:ElaB/YqjD/DUF883 family membrane-anchored ribosome-binding protein